MIHGDIINRNSYPLPAEEIRINPSPKLTWDELIETKRSMLQCYQCMLSLLSHVKPMNMDDIRHKLIFDYYFPSETVNQMLAFIVNVETSHIEFEELEGCRLSEKIYLKPREKLSLPMAEHSVWMPTRR